MADIKPLFSSKTDHWGTPQTLFDELDKEFDFTLDPAGHPDRILKNDMFTITPKGSYFRGKLNYPEMNNGLNLTWGGERVFINPPYTEKQISAWVKKCFDERNKAELIVLLIPARTDTKYFHDLILYFASIRFVKGRVRFWDILNKKRGGSSTFPVILCIYQRGELNGG